MRIVKPQFEIVYPETQAEVLREMKIIERFGRICYKSEERITADSYKAMITRLLKSDPPHESVIEHGVMRAVVICDRGISHEVVRHRLASYSQESTRYCLYSKDKFGNQISTIEPPELDEETRYIWNMLIEHAEGAYMRLIQLGISAQIARSVLPTSTKTEIGITANLREWRHIFNLRCSDKAHPQIVEVMKSGLAQANEMMPLVFGDIAEKYL